MLADIVIRYEFFKRVGYFDVVSENFVIGNFQIFNACNRPFALFHFLNLDVGVAFKISQSVKFLIEIIVYIVAVFTVFGRVGADSLGNQVGYFGKIV